MNEKEKKLFQLNLQHQKINGELRQELAETIRENEKLKDMIDVLDENCTKYRTIVDRALEYIEHQKFLQKQLFYRFKATKYDIDKVEKILKGEDNE